MGKRGIISKMSAQRFFVTGLPSSRIAWLSALLSTGPSICFNQPSLRMVDVRDLERIYTSEFYHYVGVADSSLGFFIDRILDQFSPRTVIVERQLDDVEHTLAGWGLPASNYCELLKDKLEAAFTHPLAMRVPFEALDDWRWAQQIHAHLVPGLNFDETRFYEFVKLQIDTDPYKVTVVASEGKEYLANVMREIYPMIRFRKNNVVQVH